MTQTRTTERLQALRVRVGRTPVRRGQSVTVERGFSRASDAKTKGLQSPRHGLRFWVAQHFSAAIQAHTNRDFSRRGKVEARYQGMP